MTQQAFADKLGVKRNTVGQWECGVNPLTDPEPIARLFFHEKEALDTAVNYLVIIGFSEVFMSIELMTVGALSGLGRTRLSSTISVILTGSRIPLALILTHAGMGLNGVWWALTISSIVKGIVFTLTFRHISRRLPEKV